MNALKKLLAWVHSGPQQEELDARREHYEVQQRKESETKTYVDAYYEVAELLQVEKADFKPLNLSVPEVVKAHILSLMAVETAYLNLLEKNTQRKKNLNELYGKISNPNIKISSKGVAVDQGYFWNYDMDKCPQGKVQLLGKGGIPAYGYKAQGGDFWQAWAPLPKTSK